MNERSQTQKILEKLVSFPSVSNIGNLEMIGWIEDFLASRGFACHRVPDPEGSKAGLYASLPAGGEGGVLLSAHSDVVPVEGQDWTSDPFRVVERDGRLHGRGTVDMKGFLACMLSAADKASHQHPGEPLKLAVSYDEELGCRGIAEMIGQLESTIGLPRLCVVGEPTSMQIVHGHKGKLVMRAECRGRAGHSSRAPKFVNALHLVSDLIGGIRSLQEQIRRDGPRDGAYDIPHSTLHVGRLTGGVALNIVPDRAEMDFEFRHLPDDPPDVMLQKIKDLAARLSATGQEIDPESGISIEVVNSYPGLETGLDSIAVARVSDLLDDPARRKVDFGTEAGFFAAAGVPTVVCGPGSISVAHQPDEFIEITQLEKCEVFLDRLVNRGPA